MQRKMMILEEDAQRSRELREFFQPYYEVDIAQDGVEGLVKAIQSKPDVVLMNHNLPKLSGIEVCKQLRQHSTTILFILGDQLNVEERIMCFEAGADDVVEITTHPREILCRIQVLLRRASQPVEQTEGHIVHFGPLTMNKLTHKAYIDGQEVNFTRKEFAILWVLVNKQNEVVSRNELLRAVWSYDHLGDDRMIDTHLNRTRKKLYQYTQDIAIKTVWGVGYKIEKNNVIPLTQTIQRKS